MSTAGNEEIILLTGTDWPRGHYDMGIFADKLNEVKESNDEDNIIVKRQSMTKPGFRPGPAVPVQPGTVERLRIIDVLEHSVLQPYIPPRDS